MRTWPVHSPPLAAQVCLSGAPACWLLTQRTLGSLAAGGGAAGAAAVWALAVALASWAVPAALQASTRVASGWQWRTRGQCMLPRQSPRARIALQPSIGMLLQLWTGHTEPLPW